MRQRLPNYAENRLAELCALRRPLTDAEQREAMLRARQARSAQRQREQYASDPAFRAAKIARATQYWRGHRS